MGNNFIIDVFGWGGVVVLLIAYGLISTKKLEGDSFVYQFLNLAGSALLIINSFYYGAYPSVSVNVVWIGIAIFTLTRKKRS
jgi:hypothetical protein